MATIKLPDALGMWGGAVNNYIDGIGITKLEPGLTVHTFVYDQKRASLNSFVNLDYTKSANSDAGGAITGLDTCPGKICGSDSPTRKWSAKSRDSTSSAITWDNEYLIYCYYDCDYPPTNVSLYKSYCNYANYSRYLSSVANAFSVAPSYFQNYFGANWSTTAKYYTAPPSSMDRNKLFIIYFKVNFKVNYVASAYKTFYEYILRIHFPSSLYYKETDWFLGFRIIL